MGPEELEKLISNQRVAIETSLYILALENNQEFPLAIEFFRLLPKSKAVAYASVLSITEVMNKSYELKSLDRIPDRLDFIAGKGLITLVNVDRAIALKAAEFRASYNLKTPDAIHLATATERDCQLFFTADKDFSKIAFDNLKVVVIPARS